MQNAFPDTDPHRAVVKHVNSHLLFILILRVNRNSVSGLRVWLFDEPLESLRLVELQEYGRAAGVPLDLHAQDAVAWPLLTYMLQAVDG